MPPSLPAALSFLLSFVFSVSLSLSPSLSFSLSPLSSRRHQECLLLLLSRFLSALLTSILSVFSFFVPLPGVFEVELKFDSTVNARGRIAEDWSVEGGGKVGDVGLVDEAG